MRQIPLRTFIDDLLEKCNIENNDKNVKKFRIKCTRSLQKLGFWDSAPTVLNGRNNVKLFTKEQLDLLEADMFNYLIKRNNIQQDVKQNESSATMLTVPIPQAEQDSVMLKALFRLHFTDINLVQWQKDRELVALYESANDPSQLKKLEYILATQRLHSDNKSAYYKPKS